jgi:hypothetical protein
MFDNGIAQVFHQLETPDSILRTTGRQALYSSKVGLDSASLPTAYRE